MHNVAIYDPLLHLLAIVETFRYFQNFVGTARQYHSTVHICVP